MNSMNAVRLQSFINTEEEKTKFTYLCEELHALAAKVMDVFEGYIWPPVREARTALKNVLRVVVLTYESCSTSLSPIIAKIGTSNFISFLFALKGVYTNALGLSKNLRIEDTEGVALSALSTMANAGLAMDELNTTFQALEQGFECSTFSPITIAYKIISLPLVICLLSYSIIRNTYNIAHQALEFSSLPSEVNNEADFTSLKELINGKLDPTQEEIDQTPLAQRNIQVLKDRKRNILVRHTDIKIFNIMKKLSNVDSKDTDTANKALRDIKRVAFRKIGVSAVTIILNAAQLTAIALANFFTVSSLVLPITTGSRAIVNLGSELFQSCLMDKGLELPEFTSA